MQSDTSRHLIFVYGTLLRGSCRHHVLVQQEFLGEARTKKCFRLFNLGTYPGLVDNVNHGFAIQGELYKVTPECLKKLDQIEAIESGLYERKRISLQPPWADVDAVAYFFLGDVSTCVDLGSHWSADLE